MRGPFNIVEAPFLKDTNILIPFDNSCVLKILHFFQCKNIFLVFVFCASRCVLEGNFPGKKCDFWLIFGTAQNRFPPSNSCVLKLQRVPQKCDFLRCDFQAQIDFCDFGSSSSETFVSCKILQDTKISGILRIPPI